MILVTGASGTVGTALLTELSTSGTPARAAFHSPEKTARAKAAGHDAVSIDFAKPESLRPALAGVDAVFLLGSGGLGQVQGESNVVAAAKSAGVKRIVKLSVIGAPEKDFSFAKIHHEIERVVESSGLAWTFLRPNGFMQNFGNFMGATIKNQHAIFTTIPDAGISYIDARDVARVAAITLTSPGHEGKAYALTGPAALTYRDAAAVISSVTGAQVNCVPITEEAAKSGMMAAGIPDFYADYLIDLERHYKSGKGAVVTSAVRDVTGQSPRTFDHYARDYAAAFVAGK